MSSAVTMDKLVPVDTFCMRSGPRYARTSQSDPAMNVGCDPFRVYSQAGVTMAI